MMPTKPTEEAQEKICQLIRAGSPVELACDVAGISVETYKTWMRHGLKPGGTYASHRLFRQAVETARAENEAILAGLLTKEAKRSWRAAAWMLEHRYPERWSKDRASDINTDEGEHQNRSPAQAIRDELAERRAPGA